MAIHESQPAERGVELTNAPQRRAASRHVLAACGVFAGLVLACTALWLALEPQPRAPNSGTSTSAQSVSHANDNAPSTLAQPPASAAAVASTTSALTSAASAPTSTPPSLTTAASNSMRAARKRSSPSDMPALKLDQTARPDYTALRRTTNTDSNYEPPHLNGDSPLGSSPNPALPGRDSSPALSPGLPNNGTGSSPNPALPNNDSQSSTTPGLP